MALRVPGATTPSRLWRNVIEGRDCLARLSADALRRSGIPQRTLADPDYVRALPALDDIEHFDAGFFDMSALEAGLTDPGQRLFLECAWEALEGAGVVPGRTGPVTGVFGGFEGDYQQKVISPRGGGAGVPGLAIPIRIGNAVDFLTTRVSHKLDLVGPSVGVMSACATSLMAVDLAVHSLRRNECEVALAGGATVLLPRLGGYFATVEGMLSPTGRLRPFDAGADGTIFGSGIGVVALRPLADALAAGNPIHGVILGTGASNDGNPPGKESFIAPSAEGQIAAIEAALADARVSAETLGYVEAHGTGTRLGDPIEFAALAEVFRRRGARAAACSLGSIKANVGHLRCAAGVASLIKTCLALSHRVVPPLANFERLNPGIDLDASPFRIDRIARPWEAGAQPRRAGVSSFGFGGSNVHVVVEEAPPSRGERTTRRIHLLPLSARSETALGSRVEELRAALDGTPDAPAADVAHTLQVGRSAFAHRACFVAEGEQVSPRAIARANAIARGVAPASAPPVVFLFPGQGSQRYGAGRGLYAHEPLFREVVDGCAEILAPLLGHDIRVLSGCTGGGADAREAAGMLRLTANAQPVLFVLEYATARLLMSLGVAPAAMLGHSLGEVVAACLAGVFSLADALKIVAMRARLMQRCEPGSMAAVFLPERDVASRLPDTMEIAAVNAPSICVVSGPTDALERFCRAIEAEGVGTQRIDTSHAFHSRMMEPALPEFARVVADVALAPPGIPVISNATGAPLTPGQATDPRYWADHIRHAVRFSDGMAHLLDSGKPLFVEAGPGSVLGDLAHRHDDGVTSFSTLAASTAPDGEPLAVRSAVAGLWCAGADIDWARAGAGEHRRILTLPTYPFERLRHWHDDETGGAPDPDETLYERGFRPAPIDTAQPLDRTRPWIVVGSSGPLLEALRARLVAEGARAFALADGDRFARGDEDRMLLRLDAQEDFIAALAEIKSECGAVPPRVLHLGSVTGSAGMHNTAEAFEVAARTGFWSLVALTKAAHDAGAHDGLEVTVVADALARLDGEAGSRHAEKAAVLGASRDIPLEIPGLRMRVVDVPCLEDTGTPAWLVDALVDEAQVEKAPSLVALRPGARYEEQLYALPEMPRSRPRLRDGGVVLITGGTGGLGLEFARVLFDECHARLALTARWKPPPEHEWTTRARQDDRIGRALAAVLELRARGAEVLIVQAEIADRADVARAIESTRARFGALHGVIHAAGALQPTPVLAKTRANAARVFGGKVHGAFHLDELLADEPLDLYLPVSSQASHFPGPGQVDYAAANAVLDVLAQNRAVRHDGLACAIGWGAWQDVGLAVRRLEEELAAEEARRAASNRGEGGDARATQLDHPILRARSVDPSGTLVYEGELHPGHWVVDDHRLDAKLILAGTAILQLVASAFAEHAPPPGAIDMTGIAFLRPVFTGDAGTSIRIVFAPSRDDESFVLRSRPRASDGEWQDNATGFVRRSRVDPRPVPDRPPASAFDGVEPQPPFGRGRLKAGPRWMWQRFVVEHAGRCWNRVVLPAEFVGDLEVFDLHPALFDGTMQEGGRHLGGREGVPHTYDAVRVHGRLTTEVLVVAEQRKSGATGVTDLVILDPDGRTLVEIEGCVMRPLEQSALAREGRARAIADEHTERRVVVDEPGSLDSIRVVSFAPRAVADDEVEIEVRAAGLNFRDVLTALGEMPAAGPGPFIPGGECSGIVRAVGAGIDRFKPGDAVVAIARGTLGTRVVAPAHAVAIMPDNLDFARAAGLPIVFLTARYALETLGRLARGERVLIHAAAGGVGLAAIQVARRLGAEIYATVGHADKRGAVRSLGVEHVFDSRSLSFVEGVLEATGGEGVDVVLNSLAGEFIPASLRLLRPQGRFIEIGKRDLLADTALGLAPFLRNLSFAAFDLGQIVDARLPQVPRMFDELMDLFARGELVPPPTLAFPLERVAEGFRHMARARHIGKIVFEMRADADGRSDMARHFEEKYGAGVSVEFGRETFRRVLGSNSAPSYLLAMGAAVEGVGRSATRPRGVNEAQRSREGLSTPYRAPSTEVEKSLTLLWEKTLGVAPIGVDDDFLDLGGDSIEAIQLQHAIQRDFDLRIKNTEFLAQPTIAALSALIEARKSPSTTAV